MKTKLIAFTLVFVMLVSHTPAVAADTMSATPTVEEILSEYHRKAFEAQTQDDTETASTWSCRGGNTKTLEQETVDTLTNAGYEAYYVAADDYENIETELKTDITSMGLDTGSSYIIVVSGDDSNVSNPDDDVSTFGINPLPGWDQADVGDDSTSFFYTYEGTSYLMRYVTVTNADVPDDKFFRTSAHLLSDINKFEEIAEVITEYALSVSVSYIPYAKTICSVVSLLGDVYNAVTQSYIETLDPGTIDLRAGTLWTRSYIQVYNESDGYWYTTQSSEYAESEVYFLGDYVYDEDNNQLVQVGGVCYSNTVYSPYYNKTELRKTRAVIAYLNNYKLYDHTGDIDFYFTNPDSEDPDTSSVLLFTHTQDVTYKYPYKEDN